MNVKLIGNKCEKDLLKLLQKNGYWCHLFGYNANGQPCDIVALKDNKAFLIDVKHTQDGIFRDNRVEPNQRSCFSYALSCGVKNCGFAIYDEKTDQFYWLDFTSINHIDKFKYCVCYLKKIEEILQ